MNILISFLTFGIIFGLIDAVWLKSTNKLYAKELGHLMREKPNFVAAVIFYVLYVLGILYFSLVPGLNNNSLMQVISGAAVLAFVSYATYDLTNLATIKGWSTKIVIIDIIWGTTATTVATTLSYLLLMRWF